MSSKEEYLGHQKPFHDKVHREADDIIKYFIVGYFIFGLFLSIFYSSWSFGIVMGSISLGIYYLIRSLYRGTLLFRLVVSFLFWNYPLQFLIQLHGTYEIHFFYFISLTVLLFYEDWKVLLPAIIYAIITSVYIFYSQLNGLEGSTYFENIPRLSYGNAILHLGILLLYAGLCILWAKLQKKQTENAALNNLNMQDQLQLMDININFANGISQGDLSTQYGAEEPDKLGQSLMEMRDSLVEATTREAKERFVNVGLASIGEILRNNADNLNDLCDKVIEKLVSYMKANQGGIFIINEDENKEDRFLKLMACRAYERKKYLEKRVEIGQGLVGQSALEKQTIYMTKVPEDYINITSGLGVSNPDSLLIVPLKSNEEIVGVIEMASFKEFSKTDIEFLEKVGESIASTVISTKTNQATKELLEQSRQMTEEMQAQEEEMRQNMEEMQATQEEMGRAQKELSAKEANLNALINNTSDSIILIDRKYDIIIMNDVIKDRYKGTQYEGMAEGSNSLEMLGDVRDEWKDYYDRAMAGERLIFTIKSTVKGENTWREYFINPIKENDGNIIGASIFSRDVTGKMKLEVERKEKRVIFKTVLNNAHDLLYAVDKNYKLIELNDQLKSYFSASDLHIGDNLLDVMDPINRENVKKCLEGAVAGEIIENQEVFQQNDSKIYLDTRYQPILDDENDVVGIAVCSSNNNKLRDAEKQVEKLLSEINALKKK